VLVVAAFAFLGADQPDGDPGAPDSASEPLAAQAVVPPATEGTKTASAVEIPEVAGKTLAEAHVVLSAIGVTLVVEEDTGVRPDAVGDARIVLDQDPHAGAVVDAGTTVRVRVPAGLRTGEHLRLKAAGADGSDLYLPVLIRGADGLSAIGDDLYMTCPVPLRLLEDGGRLEIETHAGPRSVWLVGEPQPMRLRLRGLGLPARGGRPQGHLFVTLQPSEDAPSAAEDLLVRFTRVWTPDRLAA